MKPTILCFPERALGLPQFDALPALCVVAITISWGRPAAAVDPGVQTYVELDGPSGAAAGMTVAAAGDHDADGVPDILVGDGLSDVGGLANVGQVYLYSGGPTVSTTPLLTFVGEGEHDYFGRGCIAGIGDFNADTRDDIAIGVPSYSGPGSGWSAGRVYVYYGGASPDTTADWVITGTGAASGSSFLGESVVGADYNGDGQQDLVVGTYGPDSVYVYFGGPTPDTVPDVVLTGPLGGFNEGFGASVCSAGDFNDDGHEDVCIGAPNNPDPGRAYVYFGGPGADDVADVVLDGDVAGGAFGGRVAGLGDFDGDGIDDLAVSDWSWTGTGQSGRVCVYLGGSPPDAVEDLVLVGEADGDYFGYGLAGPGDVDGDGHADLLVGAPHNDSFRANGGRAYLILGGSPLDATVDFIVECVRAGDECGTAVSGAGDVNEDGRGDFLVGLPYYDVGSETAGRATLLGVPDPTEVTVAGKGTATFSVWPNPLRRGSAATLRFDLGTGERVTAELFDVRGTRVAARTWTSLPAGGMQSVSWSPSAPAGVYFVRMRSAAGDRTGTRRWVLLR